MHQQEMVESALDIFRIDLEWCKASVAYRINYYYY